jgi:hypothetical protein
MPLLWVGVIDVGEELCPSGPGRTAGASYPIDNRTRRGDAARDNDGSGSTVASDDSGCDKYIVALCQ